MEPFSIRAREVEKTEELRRRYESHVETYKKGAAIVSGFADEFREALKAATHPIPPFGVVSVQIPSEVMMALMMMLGDDVIRIRDADLEAAAEWASNRKVIIYAETDLLGRSYTIRLER